MWFVESIPALQECGTVHSCDSCSFEGVELNTPTNFLTKSKGHCLSDAHSTVCTRPAALLWIVSSITLIITFFFSKRTFQGDELEAAVSRWHGSAWKGTRCLADNCHDPLISQEDGLGHFRRVGPSVGNMNARCLCLIMIQIIKSITVTRLWQDADHMKAHRVLVIKGPEGHSWLLVKRCCLCLGLREVVTRKGTLSPLPLCCFFIPKMSMSILLKIHPQEIYIRDRFLWYFTFISNMQKDSMHFSSNLARQTFP